MNEIKVFNYQNNEITFANGKSVMVNATQMAKTFGKLPSGWLRTKQSEEYISALSAMRNCIPTDLVKVINGGANYGTWMHEDVAIEFARWLSPSFAIWCNDRIKELLTQGVTTIGNDDEAIMRAMLILQQRVKDSQQKVQILEGENEIQQQEIKSLAPKAKYTDDVLQSSSTFTTTQIAQGLGMTAQKLNKKLQELGVQYRQSGQWLLKGRYKDMGIAKVRVHTYFNEATDKHVTTQALVWTEKGRLFIHSLQSDGKL